ATPSDLLVTQPTKFDEFKTTGQLSERNGEAGPSVQCVQASMCARAIGLAVAPTLLVRADEVIEYPMSVQGGHTRTPRSAAPWPSPCRAFPGLAPLILRGALSAGSD